MFIFFNEVSTSSFKGHIACDSESKSEIVVPVHDEHDALIAVLDIDSIILRCFSDIDRHGLEYVMDAFRRKAPKLTPKTNEIKHAIDHF